MTDMFAQPAKPGGDSLDLNPLIGALIVFDVAEFIEHVQTVHTQPGEVSPAVRATVHVLDGPHAGQVREDALIFGRILRGQLRPMVGRKVLGRLNRGVPTAPGKTAPWVLDNATESDIRAAVEWESRRSMSAPAPAASSQAPF